MSVNICGHVLRMSHVAWSVYLFAGLGTRVNREERLNRSIEILQLSKADSCAGSKESCVGWSPGPYGVRGIGVNSYWAQGLKPPTFMIMRLAYMTSPPHFCDVILSKLCFNCLHWFYAMLINRQLDHSFPAVLDILNLQAPLDIQ